MSEEGRDPVVPPRPDAIHPTAPADPGDGGGPRPTWGAVEALWVYLTGLLTTAMLVTAVLLLVPPSPTANIAASMAVALLQVGLLLAWLRWRHPGALAAIGLRAPGRLRAFRAGVGFGLLLYPATILLAGTALQAILVAITGKDVQPPQQVPSDLTTAGAVLVTVYAVLIAPLAEEFFFRGILATPLVARFGLWRGAFLSSLAFASVHYARGPWADSVLLMGVMIPVGMGLVWIRSRRGSLYASIGAHVVFNVIGLTLIAVYR
ncbi:MAG: lysostaphin resistance A-like protein [Actinomycetota bacterium]